MAKELLLYSGIYNFVAENLIKAMNEFKSHKVNLRINTGGGDLQASWGIIAKMQEHGDVHVKVDAAAMSAGFNICLYAKTVECLDVTNFMAHRAAYTYGGDSAEEKQFLAKVNADLRKQMEARIDSAKLKEMKGVTIADLFEKEERIMVFFNAEEAKKLGIVSKINKLSPEEINNFNETFLRIAAEAPIQQPENPKSMTASEFKEKHPTAYAEIVQNAIAAEQDRVNSIMVFAHLDPDGAKAIIKSGKPMTETQRSEFALKAMSPEVLAKITADNTKSVKTEPVIDGLGKDGKPVNQELATLEASVRTSLGLDKAKSDGRVSLVMDTHEAK